MSGPSTPMMSQYRRIKRELPPDVILFFRLGDFYEMFFEDAREAAAILNIALTRRQGVPMCGVPYHSADQYIAKLLRAGRKVAICDQMEDPALARGVVRREVTRIVTPGTVLEENVLETARHNYLAGLNAAGRRIGVALLDLSTGAFFVEEYSDPARAADSFAQAAPAECIVPESQREDPRLRAIVGARPQTLVTACDDWTFEPATATDFLARHFQVCSLAGFGCEDLPAAVGAAGAVLYYVIHTLRRQVGHIRRLQRRNPQDFMLLDEATLTHLEVLTSRAPHRPSVPITLLEVLDTTRTPMGARLLREWLQRPLRDVQAIRRRHDAVEALVRDRRRLTELRERLSRIRDLERLIARLGAKAGNARDMLALADSLAELPGLAETLGALPAELLRELSSNIRPLPTLVNRIRGALVEDPPASVKDGGLFRKGYHPELDELREAATAGRQWLAEFQAREQQRTGIKSLKVRHNKVFGYYIEVTKSNLAAVPPDYIRKQTLVHAERFITPELKEYENRILGAQERALALEEQLFEELRAEVVAETAAIQQSAEAVAVADVLAAFADRALALNYTRPVITEDTVLRIREGRHPVLEQLPEAERFVPNDTLLNTTTHQILVITGPNMAGKSTYIRQVALIVIMAQAGSFVPASEAEIGVVDRVFTRVGASDDIARGRSTFMVEMQETANILHNATPRSLVVLDEIGRGTSTFDGISIAWAVAEYLHSTVKAKTLFATHFHELADLALTLPGVKTYNVLVRERGDQIVFLRRIVPGAADKSYGIQVARLAGLPMPVVERAREILSNLEEGEFVESGQPRLARRSSTRAGQHPGQLPLFEAAADLQPIEERDATPTGGDR